MDLHSNAACVQQVTFYGVKNNRVVLVLINLWQTVPGRVVVHVNVCSLLTGSVNETVIIVNNCLIICYCLTICSCNVASQFGLTALSNKQYI